MYLKEFTKGTKITCILSRQVIAELQKHFVNPEWLVGMPIVWQYNRTTVHTNCIICKISHTTKAISDTI